MHRASQSMNNLFKLMEFAENEGEKKYRNTLSEKSEHDITMQQWRCYRR